jgi:hypothetical protein
MPSLRSTKSSNRANVSGGGCSNVTILIFIVIALTSPRNLHISYVVAAERRWSEIENNIYIYRENIV